MNRCDGGPDETVRFCDSAKTVALLCNSARTRTGPGIVPEKTEIVTSPLASVVFVTLAVEPAEPIPTPPGLVRRLKTTDSLGRAALPARTLNVATDCSSAPEPWT